ncbi:MAG: hypothetical protein V1855_02285 [bacterium]
MIKSFRLALIFLGLLFLVNQARAGTLDGARIDLKSNNKEILSRGLGLLEEELTAKENVDKKTLKKIDKALDGVAGKIIQLDRVLQLRILDLYKRLCQKGHIPKKSRQVVDKILKEKSDRVSAQVRQKAQEVLIWVDGKKRIKLYLDVIENIGKEYRKEGFKGKRRALEEALELVKTIKKFPLSDFQIQRVFNVTFNLARNTLESNRGDVREMALELLIVLVRSIECFTAVDKKNKWDLFHTSFKTVHENIREENDLEFQQKALELIVRLIVQEKNFSLSSKTHEDFLQDVLEVFAQLLPRIKKISLSKKSEHAFLNGVIATIKNGCDHSKRAIKKSAFRAAQIMLVQAKLSPLTEKEKTNFFREIFYATKRYMHIEQFLKKQKAAKRTNVINKIKRFFGFGDQEDTIVLEKCVLDVFNVIIRELPHFFVRLHFIETVLIILQEGLKSKDFEIKKRTIRIFESLTSNTSDKFNSGEI